MRTSLLETLRCPVSGRALNLWKCEEEVDGDVLEGTLVEEASGNTYSVHAGMPILLPPARRAVDDLALLLSEYSESLGIAEAIRRLADGEIEYPLSDELGRNVTSAELREAAYRESEAFWDTYSRNRLVQQQINAQDQHIDAMQEVWLRADVNFAETILDVGTGWGGMFQRLLETGPMDADIWGLDTAFLNLKIAQGRAARSGYDNAAFAVGDICLPPFPPETFDSIVSWYGVGAVPRLTECLEAVAMLLVPGGRFAAAWTPLMNDMDGLAEPDTLRKLTQTLDVPTSPADVASAAMDAGFLDVDVVEAGPIYVLSGQAPLDSE